MVITKWSIPAQAWAYGPPALHAEDRRRSVRSGRRRTKNHFRRGGGSERDRTKRAVVIAGNRLAVDDARPRGQADQCLDDQRETIGEIIARAAVEASPVRRSCGR